MKLTTIKFLFFDSFSASMRREKIILKIILIIFCVLLPFFLLLLSYKINVFFYDLSGNQEITINFLQGKGELTLNYAADEISHLNDVKKVMGCLDCLFYFLLLVLTLILTYHKKNKEQLQKLLAFGGITAIIFSLMMILFTLLSFNYSFTVFHEIFFPQGNWSFPADSLLIQTFPPDFFISLSRSILLGALFLGLILIAISKIISSVGKSRQKHF